MTHIWRDYTRMRRRVSKRIFTVSTSAHPGEGVTQDAFLWRRSTCPSDPLMLRES